MFFLRTSERLVFVKNVISVVVGSATPSSLHATNNNFSNSHSILLHSITLCCHGIEFCSPSLSPTPARGGARLPGPTWDRSWAAQPPGEARGPDRHPGLCLRLECASLPNPSPCLLRHPSLRPGPDPSRAGRVLVRLRLHAPGGGLLRPGAGTCHPAIRCFKVRVSYPHF